MDLRTIGIIMVCVGLVGFIILIAAFKKVWREDKAPQDYDKNDNVAPIKTPVKNKNIWNGVFH